MKIPPLGPWHSRRKGFRDSRNECPRCKRNAILKGLLPITIVIQCFLRCCVNNRTNNNRTNDIEAWILLNYSIISQRKNFEFAMRVNLAGTRSNSNKRRGKEEKNGRLNSEMRRDHKLLREIPRWRDTSVETPVPSREGRIAERWTRITNDAVAGKKGLASYPLCSPSDPYRYYPAYRERRTTFIKPCATRGKPFPFRFQSANAWHSTNINRVAEVRRLTLWH